MIRSLIEIIKSAKRTSGTFRDKWSTLVIMLSMYLKSLKETVPRNKPVIQNIYSFKIYGWSFQMLNFLFQEIFINRDYLFSSSKNAPLIVDCGSNIGMSVAFYKHHFPEAEILAIEANPNAFQLLEKNIEANNFGAVTAMNVALAEKKGEMPFYVSEENGTLTGSVIASRGGSKELMVSCETLSSILSEKDSIDLVKMDVEGAEHTILNELVNSGSVNKIREFVIEYHHNLKSANMKLSEFLRLLEESGFSYNIKTVFFKLGDFQDVLIHAYRRT